MSTLKQLLEQRRAAREESSEASARPTSETQAACLRVTTSAGETWIRPWAQRAVAHFAKNDQDEELRLFFTSYEVRLAGMNLTSVHDLVAFELDPGLQLVGGESYPANAAGVFRIFLDSAPDRWGGVLLERRETLRARASRTLGE